MSQVRADGLVVRCLVSGSFQPFLEALRGHEVIYLISTADPGRGRSEQKTAMDFGGHDVNKPTDEESHE